MTDLSREPHENSSVVAGDILATAVEPTCQSLEQHSTARSEVPCWTCRRRRVQCDRLLPTCKKCQYLERECLGYKKPLVWNKGVASRGKMMGKHFLEVKIQQGQSLKPSRKLRQSLPNNLAQCGGDSGEHNGPPSTTTTHHSYLKDQGFRVLVDPIFQDFTPTTRYYLDYYVQKLCSETVLHDVPGENPFRSLITLIQASPLILKVILATAARHGTNRDMYPSSFSKNRLGPASNIEIQTISNPSFYHALSYKQSALIQLRTDLQEPVGPQHDLIIASIVLFVWIELLESGRDTWRVHLDGVKKLVQMRDECKAGQDIGMTLRSGEHYTPKLPVHSYFFDTCLICDIMGTTLAQPCEILKPLLPSANIFNCLKRSEKLSFLGCPADLLYLIVVVNLSKAQTTTSMPYNSSFLQPPSGTVLSHTVPMTMDPTSIINEIQIFDPVSWAMKTSAKPPHSDRLQRTHLASAYKSAVFIYAVRVLCPALAQPLPIAELTSQVITDLCTLPTKDPFFKCIVWPTFIAGAETEAPKQRDAVRRLFHDFLLELRSENVANAAGVLEEIWRRSDREKEQGNTGKQGENGGWTDHLAKEGANWLFI